MATMAAKRSGSVESAFMREVNAHGAHLSDRARPAGGDNAGRRKRLLPFHFFHSLPEKRLTDVSGRDSRATLIL